MHKCCEKLISDCWNLKVSGCPLEVIDEKLIILKKELRVWNHSCFGNVTENVLKVEEELNRIQSYPEGADGNFNKLEKEAHDQLSLVLTWRKDFGRKNRGLILRDCSMVSKSIPYMVNEDMNKMLTILPSLVEIKAAVFSLNEDSALRSDGFSASFYQTYWEIIQHDIAAVVIQLFSNGWLPHDFNVNVLVLIPKVVNTDSLDLFRPIVFSNFKFKIISKIIAVRLAAIMPQLVSQEQRGFIPGRGPNQIQVPPHLFYTDDVLIFCKGSVANIKSLIKVFKAYEAASGQSVNCSKHWAKYLLPNADKIILKFASWKSALLYFAGRVELVKSLIQSMVIHSMSIYDWPVSYMSVI
ncbi:uncharacterized protein LOC131630322 [Vicia villosa]|uniref:uncharacterized protein LOC131630322 n=1 Tax=Vicia villosa TaxID=3911 RepID=UPI00273AD1CC|nr:uncharacterized protein LOC131630322 [Vicia villosa]